MSKYYKELTDKELEREIEIIERYIAYPHRYPDVSTVLEDLLEKYRKELESRATTTNSTTG